MYHIWRKADKAGENEKWTDFRLKVDTFGGVSTFGKPTEWSAR